MGFSQILSSLLFVGMFASLLLARRGDNIPAPSRTDGPSRRPRLSADENTQLFESSGV
jgi:hypothetical protein